MSRDRLIAVGGGLLCTLLYLSVKTGSPGAVLLTYLSQLPLFLVGLSLGWTQAAVACMVAATAIAVGVKFSAAGMFIALSALPVLIIVRQGLLSRTGQAGGTPEWYPPGLLLAWLTGYGLVMFGVSIIAFSGFDGGLEGAARAYIQATFGTLAAGSADPRFVQMVESFIRFFPSVVVTTWLIMVVVNAVLAQGVLTQFKQNRRPAPKFSDMVLPRWMTTGLAIAVLGALMPGRFGTAAQNAAVILGLPFFFLGLAVMHAVSHRFRARGLFLGTVYLILVMFGWPTIVVAGLGMVEQWAQLRRRYAPAAPAPEDE